jgi:uncharacterized protein with von Willebrand factor type A (vWA) domain
MTREELLNALELTPDPSGPIDLDTEGPVQRTAPPSPTALELDAWSVRRGEEALEGEILSPILAGADPDHAAHVAADCLAAAFEPEPRLAENCADETRGRYFRQLMETEAYQALHSQTRLDTVASELAAGHFAQGFIALSDQEQSQQTPEGQPQTPQDGARDEMRKDLRALSAAAGALQQASQDVDDLRDAQRAMGDDPSNPTNLDPSALKSRFDRIRQSGRLRAIIEHAGRYRRLAQAKQRQKTRHGQDDVVGVELGADLGRLLPAELAALADPDLELDALRRYLERGLMQRELRGVEHKARGPVVVVVDESGSMSGDGRIETAKAVALAMAWIARHQRRYCCLVGFADDARGNWLVCPPGHTDQDALLDWLCHFYSGGTSAAVPLITLPERWEQIGAPRGQTDVILITDGLLSFDDGTRARFTDWKRAEQVKLFTLIIDEEEPGDLETVSDRVWTLPDLSIEQDAIQEIVSI